ncbi:MAG: AsmA family protein [Bacteroidetes bacterium]|nr:AsmA family protein [Bacteroidota bacterium]
MLIVILITLPYAFHNKIKRVVIDKIDQNLNAKVYFKDFSISAIKHFPHMTLTLNEVLVTGLGEFKNDTLVMAAEVDATFKLPQLISGHHEINGVHLLNPLISARILENGKANYDIVKPDTSASSKAGEESFEVAIDQWSIDNGKIIYNDQLQKTYVEVGGVYHNGSGDFRQDISDLDITTKVTELTFQYNGIRYFNKKSFAADLQMEMNLKEKKFTFKDHAFQLGDFKFGFEGYFKLLEKGYETDLKFAVKETSFKNLLSLLPGVYQKDMEGMDAEGEFNCEGSIRGVYDAIDNVVPKFRIDVGVKDARFKYNHLPKALEKINFRFIAENPDGNPEHTAYDIKDLHFEIDKQPTHGNLSVKGSKIRQVTGDFISKMDIAEIGKFYPMDGIVMKGKLSSEIKIDGIYHDSLNLLPTFHADMKVENAKFRYKNLPKSVDNISFHLTADNTDGMMDHTSFKMPVFHFEVDSNPVHGHIAVQGIRDMTVNADILVKADLSHLEQIYPINGVTLKGVLNSEIKIDGRYNDSLKLFPKADVMVNLEKGYVKSKNLPVEMDSIHLNAEITNTTGHLNDTQLSLNNLTFLLDDEPFVMNGTISDLKDYNYDLKIDGLLDLQKLTQLYPMTNTTVKGTMDFDMETKGSLTLIETKSYDKLKARGTLEVKNVSYKNTGIAFPIHIDDALFTLNAHKIELTRFKAEFGKSNVSLTGHVYDYVPFLLKKDASIKGDLRMLCDTIDLNEWFPPSVATGTVATSQQKTDTSAPRVIIIPDNIGFVFDSDIKMVKFGNLDIANLDGEIKIQNGVLTLNETGFNALDSEVDISGDYNTKDPAHPTFDLDVHIDQMDFTKVYKTFVDPKEECPAKGNFSTTYSIRGELNPDFSPIYGSLSGKGKIMIDSVSIKGMKLMNHIRNKSKKDEFKDPTLTDVSFDSEIRKGKFMIFPFSFRVSKFLIEIEGEFGLENDSMNYLIKLSVPPLNKLRIPMSVTGTADKPVITTGKGFDDSDFEKL